MAPKKFLLQKHKMLEFIVGEEGVHLGPHGTRPVVLRDDRVEDVLRDRLVELTDDRGLDGGPLRVVAHVRAVHGTVDVLSEVVLAKDEVEVGLPRVVRRAGAVETDRDSGLNIEVTDGGG